MSSLNNKQKRAVLVGTALLLTWSAGLWILGDWSATFSATDPATTESGISLDAYWAHKKKFWAGVIIVFLGVWIYAFRGKQD